VSVRTAAKIISIVFHPLLMATYLIIVLGKFFPAMLIIGSDHLWLITSFVFGFTFVVPAVNLLLFRYLGSIQSLYFETRQERVLPFIFISLMYSLVAFLFYYKLPFSANFNKLMLIVAALVVVATFITFFYKVSVHSLALGGFIGILFPLIRFSATLLLPTTFIVAVTGVVISSRLMLGAHTPRETLIGSLAGILTGYGGMLLLF
jgi:membrane-associated phospholipid phosphatase